jgi:hypothetical protein
MTQQLNAKTGKPKISSRGGARPNAGRKPGSKDNVTVKHLLEVLEQKSGGQSYEELLVEDFLKARVTDTQLTMKYHNILGNKLFNTLAKIEVVESEDQVEAKKQAFAEAIAAIAGKK